VINKPGPRDPMMQPTIIAKKLSPKPNAKVVGPILSDKDRDRGLPRTPRARVVIQALPDEKKKNKSVKSGPIT
jgi:hypothetical protein